MTHILINAVKISQVIIPQSSSLAEKRQNTAATYINLHLLKIGKKMTGCWGNKRALLSKTTGHLLWRQQSIAWENMTGSRLGKWQGDIQENNRMPLRITNTWHLGNIGLFGYALENDKELFGKVIQKVLGPAILSFM